MSSLFHIPRLWVRKDRRTVAPDLVGLTMGMLFRRESTKRIYLYIEKCVTRHHHRRLVLIDFKQLSSRRTIQMASFSVSMGTPVFFGYAEFDQLGNPMVTPVAGVPTWSNTTPATGTIAASSSGQSITYTPVAEGTDTVDFSLVVGSQTFSATADITVVAAAQVLTSVQIEQIAALV
jgi:hypothetical protein